MRARVRVFCCLFVGRIRAEEVRVLLQATVLRAVNEAMFFVQPAVLGFLVFVTYHLLGNVLTPDKVWKMVVRYLTYACVRARFVEMLSPAEAQTLILCRTNFSTVL